MSYQKIKSMSTNATKRTVRIGIASSNLFPIRYETVILKNETDAEYNSTMIQIFVALANGTYKFNASVSSKFYTAFHLAKILMPSLFTYDQYKIDQHVGAGAFAYEIFKSMNADKLDRDARVQLKCADGRIVDINSLKKATDNTSLIMTSRNYNPVPLMTAICWYGLNIDDRNEFEVKIVDLDGNGIDLSDLVK